MKDDLTVMAIRKVRESISRRFDDDPKKLVEHYRKYQQKFGDRLKEPYLKATILSK